ncbi:MAG: GHKL domain-containing protein [Desulfobacterales bacterium]|nr:GHKL domain-containing protein [Desulfobacterales bacterium]
MPGIKERFSKWTRIGTSDSLYNDDPPQKHYDRLRRNLMIIIISMAIIPMILMAIINYHQYRNAIRDETIKPIQSQLTNLKHVLDIFLAERKSSLNLITNSYDFEEINDQAKLIKIFMVLREEFKEFVDIGVIDSSGLQKTYVGPYNLRGKDYKDQGWFKEVMVRNEYISDVFMGYRRFPHFVIAVKRDLHNGKFWVIRATIDTAKFNRIITSMELEPGSDLFLINQDGILQTPSRYHGKVLDKYPLSMPVLTQISSAVVQERYVSKGYRTLIGYACLDIKPFILIFIKKPGEIMKTWFALKSELFWVLFFSCILIIGATYGIVKTLVRHIQESDERRGTALREAQYANKLASVGRLAAGVSHEINNPLAIINEKAGLMMDIIERNENFSEREKFIGLISSIHRSVDRSRVITHRLLSFAKRMDVNLEDVDLADLLKEVIGFLEREAFHRNIDLRLNFDPELPGIISDKGQLQQVFLNIITNAFEAVENGGMVHITTSIKDESNVQVIVQDNGQGIPEQYLPHIFEPFFTTKKKYGTGLGLSITYGIVQKLRGDLTVQSKEGDGTTFTVIIPIKSKPDLEGGDHV